MTTNLTIEVTASWNGSPMDTALVGAAEELRIGPSGSAWMTVPAAVLAEDVSLVAATEGGFVLRAPEGASLKVARDGEVIESGREVALESGLTAEVGVGDFVFYVRPGAREAEPARRVTGSLGWTRWLVVAAVVHALVLGIFALTPPNVSALNSNNLGDAERYLTVTVPATAQTPMETPVVAEAGASQSAEAGSEGGGEATVASESGSPAPRREHGADQPTYVPAVTRQNAGNLGILAVLNPMSWGDDASPYAVGSEVDGHGGLADNAGLLSLVNGPGYGALDMGGHGRGTCNPATENCGRGLIGVGALGTHGHDGTGPNVGLRGRPGRPGPTIHTRTPTTTGGLSREQVRRTIRRHVNEVRFCYEQGLQSRPDLEGRVAVRFLISQDGRVQNAQVTSNTVDGSVGSCVQNAVGRWTFPSSDSPTGVTYPFVMQSN